MPPFVVTLGGMTVWRGATLVVGEGSPISGFAPGLRWWGSGSFLFVPIQVWVFAVVTLSGFILLLMAPVSTLLGFILGDSNQIAETVQLHGSAFPNKESLLL